MDVAEAVKWYRKAAEQGHAKAQFNLGLTYYYGEGVPKDVAEAVKWYRKAAELGNADAQRILGSLYYVGDGVPKDSVLSYKWLNLAGMTYENARTLRDEIAKLMTPQQIAEGQRQSNAWNEAKEQELGNR